MMFEKHKEYFTRAGAGGLMYPVLDEAYNNTDYDGYPDAWDGVLDYKKEWKAPGFFAAREMGAKPFLLSHFENLVTQAQRGRVLSNVEDAHELKNEVVTGKWMRNVDVAIEKSPPVLKQMLQVTRFSLLGGDVPGALGGGIIKRLWGSAYFEGIIGWILKKIKELVADVWRHKGDIVSGTLSEAGQQVGDSLKN